MPDSLSVIGLPGGLTPQAIKSKIDQLGLDLREEHHFPVITSTKQQVWIAEKDFLYLWQRTNQPKPPSLAEGEAYLATNSQLSTSQKEGKQQPHPFSMAGMAWTQKRERKGLFFNENEMMRTLIVIPNVDFQRLAKRISSEQKITVSTYQFSPWQKSKPLFEFISRAMEKQAGEKVDPVLQINGVFLVYQFLQQLFAPLVFVCLFIGLLFFLAVGSLLYFRLFSELHYDRQQMQILHKIGIDRQEALFIQIWQIRLLFLIPFVVGLLHALVAMNVFGSLFQQPVWSPFFLVVAVYFLMNSGYYLWVKRLYTQALAA
jgi:putative ABC transport system permease protein